MSPVFLFLSLTRLCNFFGLDASGDLFSGANSQAAHKSCKVEFKSMERTAPSSLIEEKKRLVYESEMIFRSLLDTSAVVFSF